jgi:predicted RNA-binding protein YlxR (DUF448 family)
VLLRVVRSPEGAVFLDERGKLPGRGAYLCPKKECVEKARKSGALSRVLKTKVPDCFYDQLAARVEAGGLPSPSTLLGAERELRSVLSLARRAGLVRIGSDGVQSKGVRRKNAKNGPMLILTASDSSESVRGIAEKMDAGGNERACLPLSVVELSATLGAEGVQVIALPLRGGLSERIRTLVSILSEGRAAFEQT